MKIKLVIIIALVLTNLAFQTSPYARRIRPVFSTPSSCAENEIAYNMTSHTLLICTGSSYVAVGGSGGGESPLTFNSPLSRSTNTISCPTCALTSGTLAQFAATTSAQLFGIISDESGAAGVLMRGNFTSLTTNDGLVWNGTNWINSAPAAVPLPVGGNINMTIANASSTGTTVNRLAKLTGAPSTAVITATSDTENAIGIVTSGAGTTGNATVAIIGQAACEFDNATTAGNYFTISTITAGKCHDAGSSFPTSAAPYGRVLSTNASAGTYNVTLMTPDVAFQNSGNGKSRPGSPNNSIQFNGTGNTFEGDADLTFTGGNTLNATNAVVATSLTVAGAAITNNIVQNSQSAAYTTVLTDAGKHIYHPSADTSARTWTIDSNANVAYPIGTAITFVNDCSAGVITIAITSDTLVLAGAGTTGSRSLAACGVATAVKVTSTRWIINGTGLT